MIELDGSYGEGGGSLTRTALALSTLTGKEFKVTNIRAGRPQPGLKAQHLHAIKALKQICGAETNEIEWGTKELYYKPGRIKSGIYEVDIGTAGSITLLLQALILPCLFAPGKVTLKVKGGTCGKGQASVDYLQNVLIPHLHRFADKIELKILKRGYYPQGGGEIKLEISPRFKIKDFAEINHFLEELEMKCSKIKLVDQGRLEQIRGEVNASLELQEKEVGERIKKSAEEKLKDYQAPINIRLDYVNSLSIGGEVNLWAIFSNNGKMDYDNPVILGESVLIEKNKTSEQIGKEVTVALSKHIDSKKPVEKWLTDQLIQFMSLLPSSKIETDEISNHTYTNIYVVEKFLPVGFRTTKEQILVEKVEENLFPTAEQDL